MINDIPLVGRSYGEELDGESDAIRKVARLGADETWSDLERLSCSRSAPRGSDAAAVALRRAELWLVAAVEAGSAGTAREESAA